MMKKYKVIGKYQYPDEMTKSILLLSKEGYIVEMFNCIDTENGPYFYALLSKYYNLVPTK
jgi:hypothetical protein